MTVAGLDGAVHYQHVAIVDVGAGHGVATDAKEECRGFVAYQVGIEIEPFLDVFVCRRGKSGRDAMAQQR